MAGFIDLPAQSASFFKAEFALPAVCIGLIIGRVTRTAAVRQACIPWFATLLVALEGIPLHLVHTGVNLLRARLLRVEKRCGAEVLHGATMVRRTLRKYVDRA